MRISDVLHAKGSEVWTVTPQARIGDLLQELARRRFGAAVVCTDDGRFHGIVSERDVLWSLAERGPAVLDDVVASICTTDVHTETPETSIEQVMAVMTEGRFRHVPVVVDGAVVGIVSIGDAVKSRMAELESERDSLSSYIHSSLS
ncbi:MAG TPA: CBS domain-containing protein [Marmoricola sp.]|nr:CBS domain-containing protein [Marmoricola sp.]